MVKNSVKRMTHILSASIALTLTAVLAGCGGAETNTDVESVDTSTSIDDWRLVWSDEFDGNSIDTSKWTHEVNCDGGGNQEQQCYTDSAENSFVADGVLNIVAKPAEVGAVKPYTSARMVTKNKGDWTYGRFEMRAKMPFGQGSWPAFWMLPTDKVYGEWPRSGEIDILETVNLKELGPDGEEERSIVGTIYYGSGETNDNNQFDSSGKTFDLLDGSNPANDFHDYAVEWQAGEIRWYVDDYLYATQQMSKLRTNSRGEVLGLIHRGWYAEFFDKVTGLIKDDWSTAPFDQDFHLILNLAVGGAFPANTNNAANFLPLGIDPVAFADGQSYEIDYVRVYTCSANPSSGAGCENIRNGYNEVSSDEKPTGALVVGVAPTPPPPIGPAVPLTIFDDAELEGWLLWDDSENTVPTVVIDEDEAFGAVAEFEILDNAGTVLGFNSRISDSQKTFNATGLLAQGTISFDMKVISAPSGTDNWLLKLEADNNQSGTGDNLFLHTSQEGQFPIEGVWQTYTFTVQSLADAGLELGLIDLIMIFPQYSLGEGAVYRVDNVKFSVGGGSGVAAKTEVFYDDALADGLSYDSFNPEGFVTYDAEVVEEGRGNVIEVVKTGATGNFYFVAPDGGFDLSSWEASGDLVFDLNVSSLDAGVELFVKFDSGWPDVSDYSVTLPTTGEWAEVRIPVADILANGNSLNGGDGEADSINLTNLFVVEPTGVMTFKLDNVRLDIEGSGGTGTPTITETFYTDALADGLSYDSFNPDGFVSYDAEVVEEGRGNVIEVVKTGATGNFYFVAADGGFDLSSYEAQGELVFDLNVSSLDGGVELYVKFDSGWPNVSDYSVTLPTTGEWAEVRIPVADILANGNSLNGGSGEADSINLTNLFVVEPTGVMTFKLDNVRLEIPGTEAPPTDTQALSWYEDALADGLTFDSFNPDGFVTGSEESEEGYGTVIQVVKTGATGNYYIVAADGGFDLSPYQAAELVFDLNVTSFDGGVELYVKFDSGWPNVSDYSVPLPTEGVWTEVRIPVADILANGNSLNGGNGEADPFVLTNLFVVEPTGVMTFKVDNIRLEF
jgi:beta-glucanase (GH16 family)